MGIMNGKICIITGGAGSIRLASYTHRQYGRKTIGKVDEITY